jgi:hypothetical protein
VHLDITVELGLYKQHLIRDLMLTSVLKAITARRRRLNPSRVLKEHTATLQGWETSLNVPTVTQVSMGTREVNNDP